MKKIEPIVLLPLILLMISISLFNFDDLSFQANMKSYIGAIASILLLVIVLLTKKKNS